jgi:hypothetical protein
MLCLCLIACTVQSPRLGSTCSGTEGGECFSSIEQLVSQGHSLEGKLVQTSGVLLVGVREEPPGVTSETALLFASSADAEDCKIGQALEVKVVSGEDWQRLEEFSGRTVFVSGLFEKGFGAAGGRVNLLVLPQVQDNPPFGGHNCLQLAPEPPPEPGKAK